jgi:arginine utilization protein RocB
VVFERFAAEPGRDGTLILLATPDEERESRGMRALREALPGLLAARGLELAGAVNLDATSDQGDGSLGRAVYTGTIGKLLPFALVLGQPSHAAYPFEGVSAALVAAEILRAVEGNPDLADTGAGDVAPPPIALEMRDLRAHYEVTTPDRVWLAFNWLYHSGSAAERFARFRELVEAALSRASDAFSARAQDYAALADGPVATAAPPRTLTLAELRDAALTDDAAQSAYAAREAELAACDNPLALSRALALWLVERAGLRGPAVVIGIAGLHYPPARLDPDAPADAALLRAARAAEAALGAEARLIWRPHFQGISDMSFLGQPARPGDAVVAANTPASRLVDRPGPRAPAFPVLNIGPWGREFHQRLERVHAPYAFDTLPRLLAHLAEAFFADAPR